MIDVVAALQDWLVLNGMDASGVRLVVVFPDGVARELARCHVVAECGLLTGEAAARFAPPPSGVDLCDMKLMGTPVRLVTEAPAGPPPRGQPPARDNPRSPFGCGGYPRGS